MTRSSKEAAPIKTVPEVNLLDKKQFKNSAVDMGQPDKILSNSTTVQFQNSEVDMGRSKDQPDKNPISVQSHNSAATTEQSQNSAVDMGRSRGQPDKKLANPTSEQSHKSAADRGFARGAAQMPPGSIDLFKIKSK